jgi:hypothetical protein
MSTTASAADPDAAQARLQAWRSRRPQPSEWAALEAILGLDEFLVRARQPPFGRWLEGLSAEPSLHNIDRSLRVALRRDCNTMARWYEPPWNAILARLAAAVDLPLLAHSMRGETPWRTLLDDERWRAIIEAPAAERFRAATGVDAPGESAAPANDLDLFELWIEAWLRALPHGNRGEHEGFASLARAARAYRALSAAGPQGSATVASIAERLAQLFRRHAGTPVAMACELAAVVLDLHRLRAGLVRRALARRARTVAA